MTTRDYVAMSRQYVDDVVTGRVVTGELERLACQRQVDDLARPLSDDWPWVFDEELASRPCEFIELLPHIKGKWARERRRIELEGWQCFTLTTVYGWVHHETGLRRFIEVYEEVARKNAKSTKCAGIALYMVGADGEEGADVFTAATTRDQARIVFDDARAMAEREPEMRDALGIEVQKHRLIIADSVSKLEPLAAEGSTLDGLNVHCAIVDEVHAHKRRDLYDVLDTARGAREQSLLWLITTAGYDLSGIGYERRTHAVKVLKGVFREDRLFAIIFTIDAGDDPMDPKVWRKANPNLGVSVLLDEFQTAARKAQAMPSAMINFLTKRLNVWVGGGSDWMDMAAWVRCGDPSLSLDDFVGERCWIGMDLAEKNDFAALCLVFEREGHWYIFVRLYLNEAAVERSGTAQLQGWCDEGWVVVTEGNVTDFNVVGDDLREYCERFDVQEIPYDPAFSKFFATGLVNEGMPMVEIRQAPMFFTQPLIHVENLVLEGKLHHEANPVMDWMISNVVVKVSKFTGLKHPTKARPENKIDGPLAKFLALGRAMTPELMLEHQDGL